MKSDKTTSKIILSKSPSSLNLLTKENAIKTLEKLGKFKLKPLPLINGAVCEFSSDIDLIQLKKLEEQFTIVENLPLSLKPQFNALIAKKMKPNIQVIPLGIARIGAADVWDKYKGNGVKVAVIDSGIDLEHPDLQPNIEGGINTFDSFITPVDENGHGTHIAGIIAAADNNFGVIGVAPKARIYSVKVLDRRGEGFLSNIIKGLEWCVKNRIKVINMSIGIQEPNEALKRALEAVTKKGIVMVAAAGNDGRPNTVDYPAAYEETIAVGAVNERGGICWFSSTGPEINLVAPGNLVISAAPGGSFQRLSGTSMAAAHVSGAVALLMEQRPWLSPEEVKVLLEKTAEKLPNLSKLQQGSGLVRIDRCLKEKGGE
ncbi:MAG: in [Thermosediminibacterales bacterium]|nr:in [Thermosediminibacterales bacterium]MDK2835349.1 in [Thermosediminibacterales bacterium]